MSNRKSLVTAALALAGTLLAGVAHARDDVQWSVTIGAPIGVPVYTAPVPAYQQPYSQYRQPHYRQPTRWDHDGDGIPNRYDRVYNPRWDRDGDGIPNRYDRVSNPPWDRDGDGIPNRYDHDNRRYLDRDRDGVPNWQDRDDERRRWGR